MSLNEMDVRLSTEHIERSIKGSPKEAIKELIWNSCDADATLVEITYTINEFIGIESITVKDNGHGIKFEELHELFGSFGCSNKTYKTHSPTGRIYHGKLGQGRYQSFSIGNLIKWQSIYSDQSGKYKYTIFFDSTNRMKISFTNKEKVDESVPSGVTVEISGIISESSKVNQLLNDDSIVEELLSVFAPYLLAYNNIKVRYNNVDIAPHKMIQDIKEKELRYLSAINGIEYQATAKVIAWKRNDLKKIYICGNEGVVFDELRFEENKDLPVTLYIMSDYFDEMHKKNTISLGKLDNIYESFYRQAIEFYDEYFREHKYILAQNEVIKIKDGKIYPYVGLPKDNVEEVERQVFDMLALEINSIVPEFKKANNPTKKLTYRLIKEAVKTNPDSLTKILVEIFDLSTEQQDDLSKLLDFTTLPSIINTAKVVSDRLLFINALEQMIYNDEIGKPIKERTQFHKILLKELWIFGEKYTYGADDISLRNVLKEYIKYLGRGELIPQIPKEALEDLTRIPDICLWQQYPSRDETIENLVIELKRPTCIIGKDEVDQIEDYAFRIADSRIFPKENTKWNFILLGKDFDSYTRRKLQDLKNGTGNFYNSDDGSISISIFKWNKIIQDNKLKHQFLKDKLNYQVNESDKAVEYLKTKYSAIFKEDRNMSAGLS